MNERKPMSVGMVAEWAGISPSGLRFLEEKGIVRAERDESSGYRFFDIASGVALSSYLQLRNAGLSGNDAARMLSEQPDCVLAELQSWREEVVASYEATLAAIDVLLARTGLANAKPECMRVGKTFRCLPILSSFDARTMPQERYRYVKELGKAWVQRMPDVRFGIVFDRKGSGEGPMPVRCYLAEEELWERLDLGDDESILRVRLDEAYRVVLACDVLDAEQLPLEKMVHDAEMCGPVDQAAPCLGQVVHVQNTPDGIVSYLELFIPLA